MRYQEAGIGKGSRARDRGEPMFDGELRYRAWIVRKVSHRIDDQEVRTLQRERAQRGLKVIALTHAEG